MAPLLLANEASILQLSDEIKLTVCKILLNPIQIHVRNYRFNHLIEIETPDPRDLLHLAQTCRSFNNVSSETLWGSATVRMSLQDQIMSKARGERAKIPSHLIRHLEVQDWSKYANFILPRSFPQLEMLVLAPVTIRFLLDRPFPDARAFPSRLLTDDWQFTKEEPLNASQIDFCQQQIQESLNGDMDFERYTMAEYQTAGRWENHGLRTCRKKLSKHKKEASRHNYKLRLEVHLEFVRPHSTEVLVVSPLRIHMWISS